MDLEQTAPQVFPQLRPTAKLFDDATSAYELGHAGLKSAEAQLSQARASYAEARVAVDETRYTAPFNGVISHRGVSLYEYIDTFKNRDIVSIVDSSTMELVGSVPADLALGVVKGARVDFSVRALPDKMLIGEVIAVKGSGVLRGQLLRNNLGAG